MFKSLVWAGLVVIALGVCAAGWIVYHHYLNPAAPVMANAPMSAPPAGERQTWLISPTGGLVPRDKVNTYLVQSRFVPGRSALITRRADLTDLLADGESLPATPYLDAFADIRAPRLADGLCKVLTASFAEDCALQTARLVEGSVDAAAGTAFFTLELVFRERTSGTELPDLATHVLQDQAVEQDLAPGLPGTESPAAALTTAVQAAQLACTSETAGQICRVQSIALDWQPGRTVSIRAAVAWLDPLPEGVVTAPPLGPATGG